MFIKIQKKIKFKNYPLLLNYNDLTILLCLPHHHYSSNVA